MFFLDDFLCLGSRCSDCESEFLALTIYFDLDLVLLLLGLDLASFLVICETKKYYKFLSKEPNLFISICCSY